jgi:hypothetical protein
MKGFIYILFLTILFSCESRLVTVPEFEPIESERKVLLEEMTGVSCPNCPKATTEIEALKALYGKKVIPVAIHGIFLSWPTDESKYDFRNEFSQLLETTYAPGTSKPAALINRAIPGGASSAVLQSPDLWGNYIEEQLNIAPKVNIELEVEYDNSSRVLNLDIGITANENINEETKLSVMILENKIIDAQEDLNEIIEDFEHNHVLRTMLTPFDGEVIFNGLDKGAIFNKDYRFLVPEDDSLWKAENIEIVVFVHESPNDGIVLQAEIIDLIN